VCLSLSSCARGPKFVAAQPNRFRTDFDPALRQKIINIAVTKIKAAIQPHCVLNDIGWESVRFIRVRVCLVAYGGAAAVNLALAHSLLYAWHQGICQDLPFQNEVRGKNPLINRAFRAKSIIERFFGMSLK
jgi:hypothetical protein